MAKFHEIRAVLIPKKGWPKSIVFGQGGGEVKKAVKLKFRVRFKGLKSLFQFHLVNF